MNTETVLRTLNLPNEYAFIDGFITDFSISRNLLITKTVDRSKSVKTALPNGKFSYTNAPDKYAYSVSETRNELTNSGGYLPNVISGILSPQRADTNPDNPLEINSERINPASNGSWIAGDSTHTQSLEDDLILVSSQVEMGASQNVIPRIYAGFVNGQRTYKDPVDYLGRAIVGTHIPNQGVEPIAMSIPFDNRIVMVSMTTVTKVGSGLFTSTSGVWSGGVRNSITKSNVYVPVADIPSLFGKSIEELEYELRTDTYCTPLDPSTHITSTSTEIVVSGNQYKGITYYNGLDASVNPPSGLITSYNKTYPGHVQRWILKQWDENGEPVLSGNGYLGQAWMKQLQRSDDSTMTVVAGAVTSYDEATKTLTYNSAYATELWYAFEELPAAGKNWGGETIIKLI
jgi:hypothetical protein